MSRNRQRTKIRQQDNAPQQVPQPHIPPQQDANPFGLSFVVPTEIVKLPSFGRLYSQNSPLFGMEQVEVKSLTAAEEDILINTSFIEQGIVFDKLIDSIMMTPGVTANDLMDCDKIAVLMTARKTGYGDIVNFSTACVNCGAELQLEISLTKMLEESLEEQEDTDVDWEYLEESNTYSFKLPVAELEVQIKLLTPEDTKHLEMSRAQKQKLGLPFNDTLEFLRAVIVAAGGISDRSQINKLEEVLPAADARKIRVVHNENMPKVKSTVEVQCQSCGHQDTKEVPFSLGWFWSD